MSAGAVPDPATAESMTREAGVWIGQRAAALLEEQAQAPEADHRLA